MIIWSSFLSFKIGYEFDFKRETDAMERIKRFLHQKNKKSPVLVPRVMRDMVTRFADYAVWLGGIKSLSFFKERYMVKNGLEVVYYHFKKTRTIGRATGMEFDNLNSKSREAEKEVNMMQMKIQEVNNNLSKLHKDMDFCATNNQVACKYFDLMKTDCVESICYVVLCFGSIGIINNFLRMEVVLVSDLPHCWFSI